MQNKALPIIFVHTGNSSIISYALNQAQKYNPDSEIILLGDHSNQWVLDQGFSHYMVSDYFTRAEQFEKVFVNMSPNPAGYECFCFQRWMILDEFLKERKDISSFVYLDTDVLLYTDITEYWEKHLKNIDVTVCKDQGPQYTFLNKKSLHELAEFMFCYYENNDASSKLKSYYYSNFIEANRYGGICDMTLLEWYAKTKNYQDTNVPIEGALFDNSINQSEGFAMSGKRKKIKFKNGKPFGILINGKGDIQFLGLHFQGDAKWFMYRFYTGDPSRVRKRYKSYIAEKMYKLKKVSWLLVGKLGLKNTVRKVINVKKPSI